MCVGSPSVSNIITGVCLTPFPAPALFVTVDEMEKAILGLNEMPYRGTERKIGVYANKGYRQIFVKKYTIVYRIDESNKMVIVITIRYSPSSF